MEFKMKKLFKKAWGMYKKNEEIINYLIVGVLTTIVCLGVYYLLVFTVLDPDKAIELQIANVVSWVVAVIFAYIANRKAVFKSHNRNIKDEASKFFGARIITLIVDMLIMYVSVTVLHFNDKIMKIISNIVIIVLNYIFSKMIVFIKKD